MNGYRVRTSTKAIIIEDENILLLQAKDSREEYYMLPGGGQHHFETLTEALYRECLEEISVEVSVGPLLYVREYMGDLEVGEGKILKDFHQLECFFSATILSGQTPTLGKKKDAYQTGLCWMPLDQLHTVLFYPQVLVDILQKKKDAPVYLGSVN